MFPRLPDEETISIVIEIDDTNIDELTAAYIQDRLSPEEKASFEAYFMERPALLERIELATVMKEGLQDAQTDRFDTRTYSPSWWTPGLAAALMLGIGIPIGMMVDGLKSDGSGMATLDAYTTQIVSIPLTRNAAQRDVTVSLSRDNELVVIRFPLAVPESKSYRVVISDGDSVTELSPIQPDGGGTLNIAVLASTLSPGKYTIDIFDATDNDSAPVEDSVTLTIE